MKHLGDVTKINGAEVPVVDTIIFGAPCQDLSVAGKRAGMKHESMGDDETTRSGLFHEAIRIIKEMRKQDERTGRTDVNIRPRYAVYENVPGAFSSNKGEDFRTVLEEIAKIKDQNATIPLPDKGKWTTAGCIVGDGWSIAWRVLDAQFWGVPQRRRRIALVADFGGQSASEILFVRQSVSGHINESQPKGKDSTSDATGSIGADDSEVISCIENSTGRNTIFITEDVAPTLVADQHNHACFVPQKDGYNFTSAGFCPEQSAKTRGIGYEEEKSPTLRGAVVPAVACGIDDCYCYDIGEARLRNPSEYKDLPPTITQRCGTGGNNVPAVITFEPGIASREGGHIYEGVSGTLRANAGDNQMSVVTFQKSKRAQSNTDYETWKESDKANTLNGFDTGDVRTSEVVCYQEKVGALCARDFKGVGSQYVEEDKLVCYTIDEKCANTYVWEEQANTLAARDYKQPQTVVAVDCRNGTESEVNGALQSNSAHSLNGNNTVRTRYTVRRLTPLECERLQGYPDGWTDIGEYIDSNGKKRQTSDAARYKALGNSIALPPWKWVLKRICACYERDATMASLFDGIGGFPYLWEQLNGKGSCLWASEIEEFPMAVTKVRIGE